MAKGYKKSYLLINTVLSLFIIMLLINIIFFKYSSFIVLFLSCFLPFLIIYIRLGYEKKKRRFTYETMFYTFVFVILFLLITYIIGLFTGFYHNVYRLNLNNIIRNVLPYILCIGVGELFRYEIVRKGEGSNLSYVLITLLFVILDSTLFINTYDLASFDGLVKFICSILFPSVFKNLLLLYLTKHGGPYPSIVYRLIMDLKIFIMPIFPNFGLYLECIINTSIPVLIGVLTHISLKQFKNNEVEVRKIKSTGMYKYALLIFLLILTVSINILTSGKFKYTMVAIGSNSMNPVFYRGDAVIYAKVKKTEDYQIKDILVFRKEDKIVVHRIISIKKVDNDYIYYTKGDNNIGPDGYPILFKDTLGVYKLRIKYIGLFSVYLTELFNN